MAVKELPVRQRGECCALPLPTNPAWAEERVRVLKALADPTRLAMAACLWTAREPVCICDFTATFELGQPTISHHMSRLRAAGLVESRRRGIWIYYSLREDLAPPISALLRTLLAEAR